MTRLCTTALLALAWWMPAHGDLIDPTRPVSAPVAVQAPTVATTISGPLKLEAIVHSNDRRLAIINGKLLRVGESLGGVRIEAIGIDAIQYSRAGRSQTLRLAEQAIQVRRSSASHEAKQ